MSARKSRASAKFTLNDKPRHSSKAAPLMLKLFSRLKMFSGYASSVHMLDLARVNAWSHLSARTSREIMGASPISAPCSFCGKNQPQTTAHCLASGACTEFQKLKIDRHDEVSRALQRFLKTRTAYHHMATAGSVINPAMFQSNSYISVCASGSASAVDWSLSNTISSTKLRIHALRRRVISLRSISPQDT